MSNVTTAGPSGDNVRSDCRVQFETKESGGLDIKIENRIESEFGDKIKTQAEEVLSGMAVEHASISIEDFGALPFTVAARIETAGRRAYPLPPLDPAPLSEGRIALNTRDAKALKKIEGKGRLKVYLPEMMEHCRYPTTRERSRKSLLYLPGNNPELFANDGEHKPDAVIFDMESVASDEMDAARILVRNALRQVDFQGAERMVRINQGGEGMNDLDWIIAHNVHVILLSRIETAIEVQQFEEAIKSVRVERGVTEEIYLMPIIESVKGGENASEIAEASPLNVALTLNLDDYAAETGAEHTKEYKDVSQLKSQVRNAAQATGIQPIDSVFPDVDDMEGLRESVTEARELGFEGKGCVHMSQVEVVNAAFAKKKE